MKNLFNICFCWLLLLVGVTACQKDGDGLASVPIEANFVAVTSDGTELKNDNDAVANSYNIFYVGEVVTFQNRSAGSPQSVKWVLSNGTFQKTVTADDKGVGVYALMIAGDYDITMYADNEELTYTNYLQVVGGGAPGAIVVDAAFTAACGGTELTQDDDALNAITSGAAITLTDTSESAGNYESVKWVFTNAADATISYEFEAAQGKSVDAAIPTAGTFNVTMYASASELTFKNFIKVTKESNLLKGAGWDGSFESESSNLINFKWGGNFLDTPDVAELSSDQKVSGSKSACIEVAGGKAIIFGLGAKGENKVAIENGKTYTVTFSYYVADVTSALGTSEYWPSIGFEFYDNAAEWSWGWKGVTYVDNPTVKLNTWTQASIDIASEVATGTTDLMMRVSNAGTSANLKIYVDDIVLTEKGADQGGDQGGDTGGTTTPPTTTPSGDDLLGVAGYDNGFEDATKTLWMSLVWGGKNDMFTVTNATTAQKHTGNSSAFFEIQASGGAAVGMRMPDKSQVNLPTIKSGKTYNVKFWVYVPDTAGNAQNPLSIVWSLGAGHPTNYSTQFVAMPTTKGVWTELTASIVAQQDTAQELQMLINNTNPTKYDFYIDDVTLTEAGSTGGTTTPPTTTPSGDDLLGVAGLDGTFESMANLQFANLGIWWDSAKYTPYTFDVAQSSAQKKNGSSSLCFNVKAGEGLIGAFRDSGKVAFPIALAANTTYSVSFDLYVESAEANASANIAFDLGTNTFATPSQQSFSGVALGSWKKVTLSVTTGAVVTGKELVVQVTNGSAADLKFYIDDITLSGSSTGGSTGGGSTGGGTTVTPTPSGDDLLSKAGADGTFEGTSNTFFNYGSSWGDNYTTIDVTRSTAQKKSGSASLKVNVAAGNVSVISVRDGSNAVLPINVTAGKKYTITYSAYVDTIAATAGTCWPGVAFEFSTNAPLVFTEAVAWYTADWTKAWYDKSVENSTQLTLTASTTGPAELLIRITNNQAGDTNPFIIYIDDLKVTEN